MSTEELTFEEYCRKKKIDPVLFLQGDPERYREWEVIFNQVHPDSFTEQKKFLINPTRKQYLLIQPKGESITAAPSNVSPKPMGVKIPPNKKSD